MTTETDYSWLLPEARRSLEAARDTLALDHYAVAVQQAQLCVEYCARAVIHTYVEPSWGHNHARDIEEMLLRHGGEIRRSFGPETLRSLQQLAQDDAELAPWHTRAVYGFRDDNRVMHPPSEICTRGVAERGLVLAERSLPTAERFMEAWHAAG